MYILYYILLYDNLKSVRLQPHSKKLIKLMSERNSYNMLNNDEYNQLCNLVKNTPDLKPVIEKMSLISPSELSISSHNIKNHIAYLKTSFQLLKKKSPEISDNIYFKRMEKVLSELICHMDRTTLYRYSMKDLDRYPVCIKDILYELPDIIDENTDNDCSFNFSLADLPDISINPEHFKMMMTEIVLNACEASDYSGEITVQSDINDNIIRINITNNCTTEIPENISLEHISQPFFTTKKGHCGVGLAIVHQICMKYNISASIYNADNQIIFSIIIPLSDN